LQEIQRESFRRHIQIAKDNKLALVIHDRDAHEDVLKVLEDVGAPDKTIFHCYSGDLEMAKYCAARGYVLSFAGTVTFKNAPALREAVKYVPDELLLVETDSPFLAPSPHRGALNTPAQIANIVRFIADERNVDPEHIAAVTSANTVRLFGSFE
jgi:TatD DNase family protein